MTTPRTKADFAILGAGAIGSIIGAHLAQSGYNVVMLAPIVRAAVFRPPEGWKAEPPAFLLARP